MRELYLSVLSGMGGGKISSSLSHPNPSTHVAEGRDGLVVIRIGESFLPPQLKLWESRPCILLEQHNGVKTLSAGIGDKDPNYWVRESCLNHLFVL